MSRPAPAAVPARSAAPAPTPAPTPAPALFLVLGGSVLLAGCTGGPVQTGGPLLWPLGAFSGVTGNTADRERRGAVELAVKSGFPAILTEIAAGGGPAITAAFDAAGVPAADRTARLIQLQSDLPLYTDNPGALVLALLVYGG